MKSIINRIAKSAIVMICTVLCVNGVLLHVMSESIYQSTLTVGEYLDTLGNIEIIKSIMAIEIGCLFTSVGFALMTNPVIQKKES